MQLTLQHHVFSSLGGYRTLYASPGLEPELAPDLEAFARRVYKRVSGPPLHCTMVFGDGSICQTKVFRNGSDHVGRPRTCVHSVVFDAGEIAEIPHFNPLLMDWEHFLEPDTNLQALRGSLQKRLECTPVVFTPLDALEGAAANAELIKPMLRALLSVHHELVVRDPRQQAYALLRSVVGLLPPALRSRFNFVRGAYLPLIERCSGGKAYFLPAGANLDEYTRQAKFIVLNWDAEGPPSVESFLPAANAYGEFLERNLLTTDGPKRIERVLALLERYDPGLVPSIDVYYNLAKGIEVVADVIDEQGRPLEEGLQAINPRGLDAVMPFWQAGLNDLALDLLLAHCTLGERRFGDGSMKGIWQKVEMLGRERDHLGLERSAHLVKLLVEMLPNEIEQLEQEQRHATGRAARADTGHAEAEPAEPEHAVPSAAKKSGKRARFDTADAEPDELTLGDLQNFRDDSTLGDINLES